MTSLLPETSNILKFQQRFELSKVELEPKDFLEWLFQCPEDVAYENLPEHTSLQRKAKQWVLDGKSIGVAYGVLKEREE